MCLAIYFVDCCTESFPECCMGFIIGIDTLLISRVREALDAIASSIASNSNASSGVEESNR